MTLPAMAARDWLVPDWPTPPGVQAVCTARAGGVSEAPYASLNLGRHVGDMPARVAENRRRLAQALGARPVFLEQVHGTAAVTLGARTPDGLAADAGVTTETGVACTIMVADCLPLLLASADGRVVGAAHAGWRGLANGVFAATLARFVAVASAEYTDSAIKTGANDVLAWLGPCIGPGAFEVGQDVWDAFVARQPQAAAHFQPQRPGKYLADLPALARMQLQALGITRVFGNDSAAAWCTVSQPSRFFSHRRDGVSGRMAACIWRTGA